MKKLFTALVFISVSLSAYAELPSTVVDALKKAGIPQESVAVVVRSADGAHTSFTHNAASSLNPASVMKLLTTNAALDLLTPAYRWKTEIYQNGVVNNGVLTGDLIIKAYGDPSFKAQEFWRLLMTLQQAGIRAIDGNLLIDKSYFTYDMVKNIANKNTFDNAPWRAYNAMPSAFLVNGRNTSFKFIADAGDVANNRVRIEPDFALPELQIINNLKLMPGACGDWRNLLTYSIKAQEAGLNEREAKEGSAQISEKMSSAVATFNGSFSPDCGERYLELSVFDDEQYAFYTFKKLWLELGGKFSGQLKIQEKPDRAVKVLEQLSEPLAYVVRDINKWSNNLMARQLLLTIAAEKTSLPATEINGAMAIKAWLAGKSFDGKSLNFDDLVIENGSGLSRKERISAEHLSQMLVSAYNSPVMPEFMSSLPILSLDGTVKKRLKDSPVSARAHLKTGSLDGVSSVAGYVLDKQNKRQVLVMMVNDAKAGASKAAQDALIEWVYSHP
jgi:D-alanyl-D-alanine carboxypeptidase/D-alanyl-D-alanine-endopeptidase (penicillin-binding protein 4)